jgi:hypothetical protein
MAATLLIYLTGLVLCLAAGIAVSALLHPRERWLTPASPALGAAAIVALAHWLGFLLDARVVAVVLCVLVVAGLAVASWRRRRAPAGAELPGIFALSRGESLALGLGVAVGALLLVPLFSLGFPSTIAPDIADGWARAIHAEWLRHHALVDSRDFASTEHPAGSYSGLSQALGAGFEYLAAIVATLLGRRTFETVLPIAALAAPIAISGWTWLYSAVTDRRPGLLEGALIAVAAVTPVFIAPFSENYLTQFFSLSLWPFAIAASYRFVTLPSVRSALPAAIGLGAIAGIYPPLLPWVVPPALLLVVVCVRPLPAAIRALVLLGLAVVIVSPIEVVRAYQAIVLFSDVLNSNAAFPVLTPVQDLGIAVGGISQFDVPPFASADPTAWTLAPALALLLGAAAVGVLALARTLPPARRPLLALAGGVAAVTVAFYLKYQHRDHYGYGAYKALVSGGTLLAGLLAVTLAIPSQRLRAPRLIAAGICLAVWAPVTAQLLQRQLDGREGFRAPDRALVAALGDLPARDLVLVEGAADTNSSFHMRMTAGYTAQALQRRIDGVGTTATYMTGGGAAAWRPARAWDYVVARDAPSAFAARRTTTWRHPPYLIQKAPALDVTPYAVAPAQPDAPGSANKRFWVPSPAGAGPPVDYIAGPVELVIDNRQRQDVDAHLTLGLTALGQSRSVTVGGPGVARRQVRVPRRERRVAATVHVPAGGTAVVTLDPGAPAVNPDGSIAPLLALNRVDVR